jgi:Fic-DOC domain mobile mystery protein B
MGINLDPQYGQTELAEEEREGLIPAYITTNAELNLFEQTNINEALLWSVGIKSDATKIISESFITKLHKRMYGDTWKWAGKFRRTDKNIGVKWTTIPLELKVLIDDAHYWVQNEVYTPTEIAIRIKHRIVSIHCFPNGNGRHSRLLADIIVQKGYELPRFTWGASTYSNQEKLRYAYIKALRAADQGDIKPLMVFAQS